MKEKIYTIPVNEAFDQVSECPFCILHKKLEGEILDYILGPSYMEEDVRSQTDKLGFCKEHYRQMFNGGNRLGLALMLETHIKKINRDMEELLYQELASLENKKKLFAKNSAVSPFAEYETVLKDSCYACSRMDDRMNSYFSTFFHLWKTEEEFRNKVKNGNGFCLEHFGRILQEGKDKLNPDTYSQMVQVLIPIQKNNFKRLEEELEWFIKKFDYRFKDEPWKNSKDSVERGILKTSGLMIGNGN